MLLRRPVSDVEIGGWHVHPARLLLERDGTIVRVKPKTMDVLLRLVDRAGDVVTREWLFEEVWPDTHVTDDVLTQAIAELRRALQDDVRQPVFIETIPRRGYRLIHPVHVLPSHDAASRPEDPVVADAPDVRWSRMGLLVTAAALAVAAGAVWLSWGVMSRLAGLPDSQAHAVVDVRLTRNTEAFELYLKARQKFRSYVKGSNDEALSLAGQAVERDPDFAEAHALIAEIHVAKGFWDAGSRDDILVESYRAASAALAVNPDLAYPHAVLGLTTAVLDWRWEAGYRQARRALELDPRDARSLSLLSFLSLTRGKTAEAVQLATRAYELDPINPRVLGDLSWVLYQARQFDEAARFMVKTLDADPDAVFARNFLPRALAYAGRPADAMAAAAHPRRSAVSANERAGAEGLILFMAGRQEEARGLVARAPPGAHPNLRARLGDDTALLDWLDDLIERRATSYVMWLRTGVTWDPVRHHPRFKQALARVGLLP